MMNRTRWYIGLGAFGLLVGGVWLSQTASTPSMEPVRTEPAPPAASDSQVIPADAKAAAVDSVLPLAPNAVATPIAAAPADPATRELETRLTPRLTEYRELKRQVLPNAEAKEKRAQLLRDEKLLADLKPLFDANISATSYQGSLMQELQNAAIDLLLEARTEMKSEAANSALMSIVADTRIDNETIDLDTRRVLAGIKAEVMYQWSAREPEKSDEIARSATGPVSQKIWSNVLNAQKQNVLESQSTTN